MPSTFEKSAIIGHWRNGASAFLIALATGINESIVNQIINEYQKINAANF